MEAKKSKAPLTTIYVFDHNKEMTESIRIVKSSCQQFLLTSLLNKKLYFKWNPKLHSRVQGLLPQMKNIAIYR